MARKSRRISEAQNARCHLLTGAISVTSAAVHTLSSARNVVIGDSITRAEHALVAMVTELRDILAPKP